MRSIMPPTPDSWPSACVCRVSCVVRRVWCVVCRASCVVEAFLVRALRIFVSVQTIPSTRARRRWKQVWYSLWYVLSFVMVAVVVLGYVVALLATLGEAIVDESQKRVDGATTNCPVLDNITAFFVDLDVSSSRLFHPQCLVGLTSVVLFSTRQRVPCMSRAHSYPAQSPLWHGWKQQINRLSS